MQTGQLLPALCQLGAKAPLIHRPGHGFASSFSRSFLPQQYHPCSRPRKGTSVPLPAMKMHRPHCPSKCAGCSWSLLTHAMLRAHVSSYSPPTGVPKATDLWRSEAPHQQLLCWNYQIIYVLCKQINTSSKAWLAADHGFGDVYLLSNMFILQLHHIPTA